MIWHVLVLLDGGGVITPEFIYGLARCYDLSNDITHTLLNRRRGYYV